MVSTDLTGSPDGSDHVLLSELDEQGVLLLTYNRPERNNGWTIELEEAYFGALIEAANDPAVRAIVVTGAGRSFCPGLDMKALQESAAGGTPLANRRRWPMTTARFIPKPVIAAVNGAAAGIGLIQMMSCDLRFASTTSKFTTAFARRGLPAENSLSWLLPRLVGTGNAMDLLLSARVVAADEALSMGLVNKLFEPDELVPAALTYARDLAVDCSPFAMSTIKQQVHADLERGAEESRLQAIVTVAMHSDSPDFEEGVMSFTERRQPQFAGYDAELKLNQAWYR